MNADTSRMPNEAKKASNGNGLRLAVGWSSVADRAGPGGSVSALRVCIRVLNEIA